MQGGVSLYVHEFRFDVCRVWKSVLLVGLNHLGHYTSGSQSNQSYKELSGLRVLSKCCGCVCLPGLPDKIGRK